MSGSFTRHVAVTPSDSADLGVPCVALYVGGAGNVNVTLAGGTTAIFTGVPAGTILPIHARRVLETSTTATAMLALSNG